MAIRHTQASSGGSGTATALSPITVAGIPTVDASGNVLGTATATDLSAPVYLADAVGSDSYAITLVPAIVSYTAGLTIRFKALVANTGAASLNLNAMGPKTLVKGGGAGKQNLATGDILDGQIMEVTYDGTDFQVTSTLGTGAASGGLLAANNLSDVTSTSNARTNLGLAIGSNVQAYDADLTTWAGITPGTGVGIFLATPSSANLAAAVTDESGTGTLIFNSEVHGAETTVASVAGTTDLGAVASNHVSITGTNTITGFGTIAAGKVRSGRFTGVLTLTYNATSMILPTAADIVTAVGDSFEAISLGSGNWVLYRYTRASGAPLAVNPLLYATNAGAVTLADMPVTSAATIGTEQSISLAVDANIIATAYSEADGAGGLQNKSLKVPAGSTILGVAGSVVGSVGFKNATSGTATLAPPTGALGTFQVTLPNAASTLPIYGAQITYTGPTAARTVTYPDASFTVARTDAANTFTGTQTVGALTGTGAILFNKAGAASSPALMVQGVPFAGTGTTSFPQLYVNDAAATASTTLSTSGTSLGVNAHTGIGNLMDLLLDGTSAFKVTSAGALTCGAIASGNITASGGSTIATGSTGIFNVGTRWSLSGSASGVMKLGNSSNAAGVNFDFNTTADTLKVKNFANNADGAITAGAITASGAVTVGGGTPVLKILSATATLDFGSTAAGTVSDLTVTVTGAALGDVVSLGVPNASVGASGDFSAWVSSSNTVTVRFANNNLVSAVDPASGTFRVMVTQF